MNKSALKVKEKSPDSAILIVDKIGVIGEELSKEFSKDYYVLLVSNRVIKEQNRKITQIKFKGNIPKVPKK